MPVVEVEVDLMDLEELAVLAAAGPEVLPVH